jgi:prepilin-type N-terminal cleavage/methylation domain-containing protein
MPIRRDSRAHLLRAFTLIELIAVIALVAILATMAVFFTAGYVQYAKHTADQRTLLVLNDALNRYKCQGGDVNALTSGALIGNVLAKMQAPVHWAGLIHQVMQAGVTYPARSISATQSGAHYHFTRYNTAGVNDTAGTGGTSGSGSSDVGFTPSPGVGYMANGSAQAYSIQVVTSTGYFTYQPQGGSPSSPIPVSTDINSPTTLSISSCNSFTFWSSNAAGAKNGSLQAIYCSGCQLTSLNLNGCTNLQQFGCVSNQLTSLDVSGVINLQWVSCARNQLTSLDVSGLTNLQWLYCMNNQLTSLTVNGLANLQWLYCYQNQLSSIVVTGDTSLPAQSTTDTWATHFVTEPSVTVTGP